MSGVGWIFLEKKKWRRCILTLENPAFLTGLKYSSENCEFLCRKEWKKSNVSESRVPLTLYYANVISFAVLPRERETHFLFLFKKFFVPSKKLLLGTSSETFRIPQLHNGSEFLGLLFSLEIRQIEAISVLK